MNCIYRTIWSDVTGGFVAVAENTCAKGKRSGSVTNRVAIGLTTATLGLFQLNAIAGAVGAATGTAVVPTVKTLTSTSAPPLVAPTALPGDASVVAGKVTINQNVTPVSAVMNVNQSSNNAIINWGSFNVGSAATVNFNQPGAQAVTLNRVQGADISQIFGKINAPGQVFIINPNGIVFGSTSQVNVGGLVATTHQLSDADFLAGRELFQRNGTSGAVINEGNITTAVAGYAALLAPEVRNEGVIFARQGTVALASGEAIALQFEGSSLIGLTVTPSTIASLVSNQRAVLAPGGLIVLSAKSVGQLASGVIQNSGTLSATGTRLVNGHIVLQASDQVSLSGDSVLDVSNANGQGGAVSIAAKQIAATDNALINASGASGGHVTIDAINSSATSDNTGVPSIALSKNTAINANATQAGNAGGTVLVRADNGDISVHGSIQANDAGSATTSGQIVIGRDTNTGVLAATSDVSGANLQAAGGLVETSGAFLKSDDATVRAKTWLLDPNNVEILATSGTTPYITGDSVIAASQIATALGNGTSVTISTGSSGATNASVTTSPTPGQVSITGTGTQATGNILVASPIAVTAAAGVSWAAASAPTLTLTANNGIKIYSPISASGTFANGTTYANNPTSINVSMTASGANADAYGGITLNDFGTGNTSLWGQTVTSITQSGSISTNGGLVNLTGTGGGALFGTQITGVSGTPVITSDQITINGTSLGDGVVLNGGLTTTNLNSRNLTSTITGVNPTTSVNYGPSYAGLVIGATSTMSAASGTNLSLVGNSNLISAGHDTNGTDGLMLNSGFTLTTTGAVSLSGFSGTYRAVNLLGAVSESANSSLSINGTQMSHVAAYSDIYGVYIGGGLTAGTNSTLNVVGNTYAGSGGDGVRIASALTGSSGALSITGSSTANVGITTTAAISGWGNTTLIGTSLSPTAASISIGGNVNAGTNNLFIQSNGAYFGQIKQTAGTLTGGNISIDNSGGTINSSTGAITYGNAIGSSSFTSGITLTGSGVTASGNINIFGQNAAGSTANVVQIGTSSVTTPLSAASININGKIGAGGGNSNGVLTNGSVIGTAPASTANFGGTNGSYNGVNPLSAFTLANNGTKITNANGTTASTVTANVARTDIVNWTTNNYLYAVNRLELNGTYTVYMVEVAYNSTASGAVYAVSASPIAARVLSGQVSAATNANVLANYWGAAASPTANGTTTVGPSGISILSYTTNATIFGASGGSGSATVNSSTVPSGSVAGQVAIALAGTSTSTIPLLKATGNIAIEADQGSISLADGAAVTIASIKGANVSIDNTNGTIDSNTGAITTGAGTGSQGAVSGISLSGGSIAATGNLNIDGISTSTTASINGVSANSALSSSGGAVNVTGSATASSTANGVLISQAVTDTLTNSVITIAGSSGLNSGNDYAVSIGANVGTTANANNVVIQSGNGSQIAQTAGTIAGKYVSIDNTGGTVSGGIISAPNTVSPLSMTAGAGLTLTGTAITATSGVNLFGNSTGASGVKVQEAVNSSGYLTIAGNSAGVSTQGVFIGTAVSANGAVSITGNNTNTSTSNIGNGVNVGAAITDTNASSTVTIQGSTAGGASGAAGDAVVVTANIAAGTNNVVIQSTNGSAIWQQTGTITGKNVSIDNTNGTINASTGAITSGAASTSSSMGANAVSLGGSGVTASGNINITGTTNGANVAGLSLTTALTSSGGNITINGSNTQASGNTTGNGVVMSAAASVTDTWGTASTISIQGSNAGTGSTISNLAPLIARTTGSSINLTATGTGTITGTGGIGSATYPSINVTMKQAGASIYDGAINANNFTMDGGGTLTLDSWVAAAPAATYVYQNYTVQGSSTLQLNPNSSYLDVGPNNVNINNTSIFQLSVSTNGFWRNTAFNFTGTSGGGRINFAGNPVGNGANSFTTNGGATDVVAGLWNANGAPVTMNLTPATSGTLLANGSYAAISMYSSYLFGVGIQNGGTINVGGGGSLLVRAGVSIANTMNINAGYVQVGDGTAVSGTNTEVLTMNNIYIASGATLAFNRLEAYTNAAVFTGSGNLIQGGAGALTLTGASTAFAGATTVKAGKTLNIGTGGSLGAAGSTLSLASSTSALNLTEASGTSVVGSNISGAGTVSQTGAGIGELSGTNTYSSATTTVTAGTLQAGSTGAFSTSAVAVGSSATSTASLDVNGLSISNAVTLNGYGAAGSGGTTGSLTNSNAAAGTATNVTLASASTIGGTGAGNLRLPNNIAGAFAITKVGSDTAILSGTTNATTTTAVNGGTLQIGNSGTTGTLGSGAVTLSNGANLNFALATNTIINNAISGNGNVSANITGDLTLSTPITLTTAGTVNMTASGALTTNNTIQSIGGTSLTGASGVALNSNITNSSTGAVNVTAGDGTTASTAILTAASGATITQSGTGNVVLSTDGQGNLTPAKIANSGSGNVSLIAGKKLSAGVASGGQITPLSGNTVTNTGAGNLYLYTGSAANTGNLSNLNSGYSTLWLSGGSLNAAFNTAYGSGNTIPGGSSTQVMFRDATAPTFNLALAGISKVYGQSDPSLNTALQTAYTAAADPTTLSTTSGSNTFGVTAATLISNLSGTRVAGENVNASPYAYTLHGNGVFSNDVITGASLNITPANLSATGTEVYNGSTSFSGSNLVIAGVNGETFTATGTGTLLNSGNVQSNQALASVAGLNLSGVSGSLISNYNTFTASQTSVNVTAATAVVNAGKVYDAGTSLTSGQVTITGVNGQTLNYTGTASAHNANVSANGSNYVSGITGLSN
ncbi:filamentous hemagglutinin N-terminal domain-containing protein, partial [Undibacterium sp. SXout20W]|uniref:filamentous hemagglutinin N-terminal domain-containing protein n=1 Tax=Undibacterium sp. SXout20W TaxID=3413051 RepID=UPI003BF3048C